MSNDPIQQLRAELVAAAHRQADGSASDAPAASRRRSSRGHRPFLLAFAGLAIAGPAAAAVTGVTPFGSGTTPDGSTYATKEYVAGPTSTLARSAVGPEPGSACRRTEFRDSSGNVTGWSDACSSGSGRPAGASKQLEVGFTVTPGQALLVDGTVGANVARVTVEGVDKPIELAADGEGRRKFSILTRQSKPVVTAYDIDGTKVDSFKVPI